MALPNDGRDYELIDGVLHDFPPGGQRHGDTAVRLSSRLSLFVDQNDLGRVYDSQSGFRLDPDNCLSPDVSFVSKERIPLLVPDPDKFLQGAPNLAIEILSPNDSWPQIHRKIAVYIRFGTRLAWAIHPKTKVARVYPGSFEFITLRHPFELTGGTVLPDFKINASELFR